MRAFLESKGFVRIPLKKINSNHFKIKAKIDGVIGEFILDTGASNSCLGVHAVSHFKLEVQDSEIKAAGAGAVDMHTQTAVAKKVIIGKWTIKNKEFVVFDLSHVNHALATVTTQPVHGIIGADILKIGRAVIDYGRNCVYLK